MSTPDDGGPAFPMNEKECDGTHFHSHPGMSLRDYFAGLAMQAEVASAGANEAAAEALMTAAARADQGLEERIAFNAYSVADAMLRERAK